MRISTEMDVNAGLLSEAFSDCGDLVSGRFDCRPDVRVFLAYIDNMVDRQTLERQVLAPIQSAFQKSSGVINGQDVMAAVMAAVQTVEAQQETELDKIYDAVLSGDTAMFIDGADTALIIASKGFKSRGVPETATEVTVMGSREAFSEVFRTNSALIRRRIRDTNLKVRQFKVGKRSRTDVALVYMADLVRPGILAETVRRVEGIDMDAVNDAGTLEQLIETHWRSPFPQTESTERPDKAAAAILEGRIAILVDNSPFALIVPATLNTLYQSSDDYFQRFGIMSLTRIVRYIAGFLAVALPGFYIATAVYHPAMLPSLLLLKMAAARENVPFPAVAEILIMEAAFELLREAGTRMPKAIGGTLGIVGGLIVGQAAVEAGIVSPIVVVVVALTAIASFSIPNSTIVSGYRIVKYLVIALSAVFGLLGFWSALFMILSHLAALESFGIPYLFPFVSGSVNHDTDIKDSIIRAPSFALRKKPIFARQKTNNP